MDKKYILAIDQGTTSSRAVIIDKNGNWIGSSNKEFSQIYPKNGWVEHEPEQIWLSVEESIRSALDKCKINPLEIAAIGITNQRETTLAWNSKTSKCVYNAIVWQCRRTTLFCDKLKKNKKNVLKIRKKTGLVVDPYFSASKISWILMNIPEAKKLMKENLLRVGTVDSFLLWRLTGGREHKTEVSNASRTMLMDLKSLNWDLEMLKIFNIPKGILPKIESSDHLFGYTMGLSFLPDGLPITGIIGDQQGALFGQTCFTPGSLKCTYGTGSFILLNTGSKITYSNHKMLTTVAWKIGKKTSYAIEGGAFICGAAVQWLRDGLGLINKSNEVESLASEVESSEGVEFIPALTGLGAPYWKPEARGIITGLSRGTKKSHLARATLDAMALQNVDIIKAMEKDIGYKIKAIYVDGGASLNGLLLQIQADYFGQKVIRPKIIETTAYGAGLIAGLGVGLWKDVNEIKKLWKIDRHFDPSITSKSRRLRIHSWHQAIKKCVNENVQ